MNNVLQRPSWRVTALTAAMVFALTGCFDDAPTTATDATAVSATVSNSTTSTNAKSTKAAAKDTLADEHFVPPSDDEIPDGKYGEMIRLGQNIFNNTPKYAGEYAGNVLSCSNCHLDAGRRANSGPMWAAYPRYPRYRSKNDKVNSFAERLQGCFQFSMNGTPPPADSETIKALTTYSYWLASGAPVGKDLPGFGYPKEGYEPPEEPSFERGKTVYEAKCAMCHGDNGQGQFVGDKTVFPPLWGEQSFNWGAGMHQLNNAAAFIKHNMPLGLGGSLSDQEAWDVARFMNSHERPQDPRFTGDVTETRSKYHDTKWSLYGIEVNGKVLGSGQ